MVRKFYSIAAAALALAAAGCNTATTDKHYQQPQKLTLSREVTMTAAGAQMQQVAVLPMKIEVQAAGGFNDTNTPAVTGTCDLQSSAFAATVQAPSTVSLPSFGQNTPPMKVVCQFGERQKSKTVNAVNLTQQALQAEAAGQMLWGFGLVGAAITAGQGSSRDKSKDLWGYPAQITFTE